MNEDQELLNEEIKKLKAEVEEYKDNWKRALADYQNLEKRSRDEKQEYYFYIITKILKKVLPAYDSLEKATEHIKDEGLTLVLKEFQKVLAEEGIKRIETVGKKFDPKRMECIEVVEGEEENIVVDELRSGFEIDDKHLIRPALVKAVKNK